MTKLEQNAINAKVMEVSKEIANIDSWKYASKKLRSCSAEVIDHPDYYILKSYNTIIACIDKATNISYDFLRYVYGFTATSCQHISKFNKDYKAEKVLIYKN